MGNPCSKDNQGTEEDRKASAKINAEIKREKEKGQKIKLLLLGAGESGKSTFAKQMKIIHLNGYETPDDRKGYISVVHQNILDNTKALLEAAERFQLPLHGTTGDLVKKVIMLTDEEKREMETKGMSPSLKDAIKTIWQDPSIQAAYRRCSEFQLNDSAEYFYLNLERIAREDYIPSIEDILRLRAKTTGINEIEFTVNRYRFQMVDVGGQRSERRKWIHCFEGVTAIIFVAASSEYDQKLYEDESTNRMFEALRLFRDITNSKWFRNTPIILFLNKDDLFRQKIQRVPLNVCFKNYKGDNSYEASIRYIEDQFLAQIQNGDQLIYCYHTTATDTKNISKIFHSVKNMFITAFLHQMGLGISGPTANAYGHRPPARPATPDSAAALNDLDDDSKKNSRADSKKSMKEEESPRRSSKEATNRKSIGTAGQQKDSQSKKKNKKASNGTPEVKELTVSD